MIASVSFKILARINKTTRGPGRAKLQISRFVFSQRTAVTICWYSIGYFIQRIPERKGKKKGYTVKTIFLVSFIDYRNFSHFNYSLGFHKFS